MKKVTLASPTLALTTIIVYVLTMTSFRVYDLNYEIKWFHAAYILNIAGIMLTLMLAVPQLAECMVMPEEKFEIKQLIYPLLSVLALIPYLFNYIVHCDQWNNPQPFTGGSVILISISLVLLAASVLIRFLSGNPGLKWHSMKLRTIFHLPFHFLKH